MNQVNTKEMNTDPKAGSDEYQLIGRPTQIIFLTENIFAKFEEWSGRGVCFHHPPQEQSWGAVSTSFEDPDGNSFTLLSHDAINREVETLHGRAARQQMRGRGGKAERLVAELVAREEQDVHADSTARGREVIVPVLAPALPGEGQIG